VQALAAVLGGTQSLHTNSRDEALSLPSEDSARLALRTQQILAYESGVADVVDPLGGSPFIEALTDELEARALDLMGEIDALGGSIRAIESGFMQREIHKSAMVWQREVERGERVIVGVNEFEVDEGPASIFKPDAAARDDVLADLAAVREQRDGDKVRSALARLGEAAGGDTNLMPLILDAVDAYATVGEICDTLERRFGKYRAPEVL
jgi:methylmalonyl-CoA mutase N-terminal domain/subunit